MSNPDKLNPQAEPPKQFWKAEPSSQSTPDVQQLSAETQQARRSAENALSEAAHARFDAETCQEQLKSHRRVLTGLWSVVALLAIAMGAVTWYGYDKALGHEEFFAKIPSLEGSVQAVSQRIGAAEEKLQTWASDWKGLGDRVTKVEKRVRSDYQLVRNYAREQANQVHRELVAELDNHMAWVRTEMTRLDSNQEAQRVRLAQLREDLAAEVASVRYDLSQQIAQVHRDTGRDLDRLQQQVAADRRDLDAVTREIGRYRVDFELAKDQSRELIPGVSMTLKKANVSFQRVEGWVQLVPDGRTLWVRGQGIQQPLFFYRQQESRPYQLVFTRVSKEGAVGYLVVPEPPMATAGGSFAGEGELSASALDAR